MNINILPKKNIFLHISAIFRPICNLFCNFFLENFDNYKDNINIDTFQKIFFLHISAFLGVNLQFISLIILLIFGVNRQIFCVDFF